MSKNKITQKMDYRLVQDIADIQSYQNESNGNQDAKKVFINISIDGSGSTGQVIFGTDLKGNPTALSISMRVRPANLGGGIDFFNNNNVKIASLDSSGNFRTLGSVTGNTTP